jgi:protein-tyrosine phosphatase
MIDIHSHILPGLDDGPRDLDESLQMCELYVLEGVQTVVATPHLCDPRFHVSPEAIRSGVRSLTAACRERGLRLEILSGGDVRLEPELLDAFDAGRVLTLGDAGTHLLLELPFQTVPRIENLVFQLSLRGVTTVLSHPERNLELWRKPRRLAELVELGCLVQVTAGSFLGQFGPWAERAARGFLEAALVHAVATDAHSSHGTRRPALKQAAGLLKNLIGEARATDLLSKNPAAMVRPARSETADKAAVAGALYEEPRK